MSPVAAFAVAVLAAWQDPQGSVTGVVRDPGGRPIEGAVVTLEDVGRSTLTDSAGSYRVASVPPGPQHLTVSRLGYASRTVHALVPSTGSVRIDLALELRPIPLTGLAVSHVGASLPPVRREAVPAYDRVRSGAELATDPRLAEPDALAGLVGAEVAAQPEAPDALFVRGGLADHTAYLLDGIPVIDPVHAGGSFGSWNPAALAEVRLLSTGRSEGAASALAGVVAATTRAPPDRAAAQATVSTSLASALVTGPVGRSSVGYLLSLRAGFPGAFAPADERSYLSGEADDVLATVGGDAMGGGWKLLFFDAANEMRASSDPEPSGLGTPPAHGFEWHSRSLGATWTRADGTGRGLALAFWDARASAEGRWVGTERTVSLAATRRDAGLGAVATWGSPARVVQGGLRAALADARYATDGAALDAGRLLGTLFADAGQRVTRGLWLGSSVAATRVGGRVHVSPALTAAWRPSERWMVRASVGRAHQFTQSLRNPESVVGSIFPANPSVAAGVDGVPMPWSDQASLGLDWSPAGSVHLEARAWLRATADVLLVAPVETGPFASATLDPATATGRSAVRGLAIGASTAGSRFAWDGRWVWERARDRVGRTSWAPSRSPRHRLDGGVIAYPTPTTSVRFAVFAALGRRGTDVGPPFEWEACNLLDRGCEFAGAPATTGALGGRRLGPYLRADLGVRKHWHVVVGGRPSTLAVHATLSNVLGGRNTLVWVVVDGEGEGEPVRMRPPSPLVAGLEWRF